jgi:hypothetical protein
MEKLGKRKAASHLPTATTTTRYFYGFQGKAHLSRLFVIPSTAPTPVWRPSSDSGTKRPRLSEAQLGYYFNLLRAKVSLRCGATSEVSFTTIAIITPSIQVSNQLKAEPPH